MSEPWLIVLWRSWAKQRPNQRSARLAAIKAHFKWLTSIRLGGHEQVGLQRGRGVTPHTPDDLDKSSAAFSVLENMQGSSPTTVSALRPWRVATSNNRSTAHRSWDEEWTIPYCRKTQIDDQADGRCVEDIYVLS